MIGVLGFDSRWGLRIFLFTIASRTTLGPTQPPSQWVPGALSLGVKRPGRQADHSPPSNDWSYNSTLPILLHGVIAQGQRPTLHLDFPKILFQWGFPTRVLDAEVKRKNPSPRRESNPKTPIVQPVAQRYTDWAITALKSQPMIC
jgi:hypothetical protein